MKHQHICSGTCSKAIEFSIDEHDIVSGVTFVGGCNGNTQGVAALCEGMPRTQLISRLKGIHCGNKGTSCPDQLAQALENL